MILRLDRISVASHDGTKGSTSQNNVSGQNADQAFVKKDVLLRLAQGKLLRRISASQTFGLAGFETTLTEFVGLDQVLQKQPCS